MGKEGTAESLRWVLLCLTAASLLLGLVLVVTGAVVLAEYNIYLDFVTRKYTETAVFILVVGLVVATVSAVGFYAAAKFNFCMMATFLTIMVVMELITAVTTFALPREKSEQIGMRKMLKETLQTYQDSEEDTESEAWDLIQTELSCCGIKGPEDYSTPVLPISCCGPLKIDNLGLVESCHNETVTIFKTGCEDAFKSMLHKNVGVVGAIAVMVAMFQIVIISSSTILVKKWQLPGHCYPCY